MLNEQQKQQIDALLAGLSPNQRIWLSGYIQGKISQEAGDGAPVGTQATASVDKPPVDIYYATETGNAKALSLQLMKAVKKAGYKAKSHAVNRIAPEAISTDNPALFIASTHGEGDPPEAAVGFFNSLTVVASDTLKGLQYAVLGLGDSSYEIFCGAAVTLDAELQRLGGKTLQETALLDVDFAQHTPAWIERTIASLESRYSTPTAPDVAGLVAPDDAPDILRTGKGYTRLEPVQGTIKDIVNLNDRGSNKETYHIEISYDDDIHYTAGDAAGIILPEAQDRGDKVPRLYSIASAPSVHDGEIHLTVALATHTDEQGNAGTGLASGYLAQLKAGDTVEFFISQNQLFKLPADETDAIMIGPGTGIAPFRSFIFEREDRGASGRNWLFYGDQHAHTDFLYQAEWQEHLATDALDRISLAFSRDQEEKIYVQHRMKESADELMAWIHGGAAIYVCGSKDPMSHDVEQTLIDIIAEKQSLSPAQAADYLADMQEAGRYVKDVY